MRRTSTVLLAAASVCCTLLGEAGWATASTAPTASSASTARSSGEWTAAMPVPGLAALNVGKFAELTDIACASGGNCAAGGTYTDGAGNHQAWIASEVRGSWHSAEKVPGTATLNGGGHADVQYISCADPGECTAVGRAVGEHGGDTTTFVATQSKDGGWARAKSVGAADGMFVTAMACPRAGDCVLGGQRGVYPSIRVEYGGTWSAPMILPGIAALGGKRNGGNLDALTCPTVGNCVVSGTYWSRVAHPPGQVYQQAFAAAGDCAAGGSYQDRDGTALAFVADEIGGRWRPARLVPGAGRADAAGGSRVAGLTCTAAAACVAAGRVGRDGFTELEKGGTWGKIRLVRDLTVFGTSVDGISCRSAGNCVASGSAQLGTVADHAGAKAFVMTQLKGTWSRPKVLTAREGVSVGSDLLACGQNGDCSVGGSIQYGADDNTATYSGYVARYTPALVGLVMWGHAGIAPLRARR